jgi:hypothetical protein
MFFYLLPASLVFTFCTIMLYCDDSTAKSDPEIWTIIVLAGLLWPATIPSILRKQYLNWRQWRKATASSHQATPPQWLV